jgi:hypothetical protein
MTLENLQIESLARRVGEPLESLAGKLLTALDFRRDGRDAPPRAGVRGAMDPREQGRTNRQPRLPAHVAPIERPARPLIREPAAGVLGLHPRTLDRWARRGRLLTIDLGGTVRIPVAETLRLQPIAAPWRTA